MITLDCESRASALESLSTIYSVRGELIDDFLHTFDMDSHYAMNDPPRPGDEELRRIFEKNFHCEAAPVDRIFWFHLTRTAPSTSFSEGIQPLSVALDRVWQIAIDAFCGTAHASRLTQMRQRGFDDFHYNLKAKAPEHAGPYAMLVRAIADQPESSWSHDYLKLPEIMEDICNGYLSIYRESIHDMLIGSLKPMIIKFWSSKKHGFRPIEPALYYLYQTAHSRPLNILANTCFDGENEAIPPGQIVRISVID